MRVIGGELGGRRLEAPEGLGTRPMLDRVREALFSTLAPWLSGARVLDLFAGSGSLGIETLSRGARHARFVEKAPQALACLRRNVEELGLRDSTEIVRGDALTPATWGEEPADIVFLDSPYPLLEQHKSRAALFQTMAELARAHLAPEGVIVFHAPRRAIFPSEFGPGLVLRERRYGSNALWYVQREELTSAEGSAQERPGGEDSRESCPSEDSRE